jgi:hypothetical protein
MADTNVPAIQFTPTGVVLPSEADILAGVQADMNAAAGGNLSPTLTSPQGQQAQSLSAIIGDKNDQIAEIVNQVDPDQADGRFQDAIGRIYFMTRNPATGTLVTATCAGLVGTVIPAGSLAQDVNGYRYASTQSATIGASGTVNVPFQCLTTGPIACGIGALNAIYQAITGWESITNAAAGALGQDVENRTDFEFRRRNSVAINAENSPQAIYAAVLQVAGVIDAYVIDNPGATAVNKGATNFSVAAHSVYVAVAGGAAADIAQAIWSKKSLGCDYNGSTTYVLVDDVNYPPPYPSYTIKWVTPANTPVYVTVNIANTGNLPVDIVTQVQNAVTAAFNGTDGGQRARIGSTIYAFRFATGIGAISTNLEIASITIGLAASPTGSSVTLGIDQLPTLATANIVVNLV